MKHVNQFKTTISLLDLVLSWENANENKRTNHLASNAT